MLSIDLRNLRRGLSCQTALTAVDVQVQTQVILFSLKPANADGEFVVMQLCRVNAIVVRRDEGSTRLGTTVHHQWSLAPTIYLAIPIDCIQGPMYLKATSSSYEFCVLL